MHVSALYFATDTAVGVAVPFGQHVTVLPPSGLILGRL